MAKTKPAAMADKGMIAGAMMGVGGLINAAGILIGLLEVVLWLRYGTWSGHTLFWLIGYFPTTTWNGIDQILYWLWMQPLWAVMALTGFAVALMGVAIEKS